MVQYSKTPSTVFYLNTYTTKTEVLKAVKNIRQKGGNEANTGMALQFLVDNHFIPSAGSRADEEVPQDFQCSIANQPVQIPKRDIVFLIDGSSSLGHANFLKICKFISSITENFVIGPDSVQVAVAQLRGGWTLNTGAALDYIYRSHFATAAGSRKEDGVPQFVVLITGAKSNDDVKQPADILKRSAIMAFALGDRNADLAELNEIAIDPSLVFNIAEFDSLPDIHQQNQGILAFIGKCIEYKSWDVIPW
eukprot:g38254.t1